MPRNNVQRLADTFTISASGTVNVDVDLRGAYAPQILIEQTYQMTADPTGIELKLFPGMFEDTTTILYADNFDLVTEMVDPDELSGSPQTTRTIIDIESFNFPAYVRLNLHNKDPLNEASVRIIGDM